MFFYFLSFFFFIQVLLKRPLLNIHRIEEYFGVFFYNLLYVLHTLEFCTIAKTGKLLPALLSSEKSIKVQYTIIPFALVGYSWLSLSSFL